MDQPYSAATIASPQDYERISDLYQFRGPEVEQVLPHEPPEMLALLREAAAQIKIWFGQDTQTVLEFAYDMDDEESPGQFYGWVQTPLEPEQIRSTMGGFIQHWLLSAWQRSDGRFNVGLEYR